MGRLTETQRMVLRLAENGVYADALSGPEKRAVPKLQSLGLLNASSGKRAFTTPAGLSALADKG